MESRQLQAKSGQVYKHRLDPQTIFLMENCTEELQKTLGVKPSQAVLIRRALRHYGDFIQELTGRKQPSIRQLQHEKHELFRAAGRPVSLN